MEVIEKDLFECNEDMIVHQVNCQGVMGSGVAKQVKKLYPEVFKGYYYHTKTTELKELLGSSLICEANDGKYIANLYGQNTYGKGLQTDYDAFENGLKEIHDFAKEKNLSVAIPFKIASDRGGGDWKVVSKIIEDVFSDDVKVALYKKPTKKKKGE